MSDENYRYCHSCGFPITDSTQKFCSNCGSALMDEDVSDKTAQMALPMKWYKFLIYFGLFFVAITSLLSGLGCLTGSIFSYFGVTAEEIYAKAEVAKQLLSAVGAVYILHAVYAAATRICLAKKMKIGPKLMICLYIINTVISIAMSITTAYVTVLNTGKSWHEAGFSVIGIIMDIAMGALLVYLNKVYFDRRSQLFIN
jgi:predicted nucleic acid-binding Zn ribbon protein